MSVLQQSLFGEEVVVGEVTQSKASSTSKVEGKSKVTVPKVEDKTKTIKVHGDWNVHFYANHFLVSDFIINIPVEGILLETLREEMEKSYPALSKQRTYWDIDEENKDLYALIKGTSKGV